MENEILFENVSFSYDGKEVFRNLNVRIPSDRHVALVGENGAGKSTFIKLLLGLYEPKQGSILVDGRPVKDRTPKERKRLFAAAFQDFYRYPLSVKENLSMCQNGEKTTADYIAALEMVGLETLKDKLDYKIGKYGENSTDLSDGQWQKIALARVLLSDAKMFLLDEPTDGPDRGIEAVRGYDECHEGSRRHYRNAPAGAGKDRRSDCGHAGRGNRRAWKPRRADGKQCILQAVVRCAE